MNSATDIGKSVTCGRTRCHEPHALTRQLGHGMSANATSGANTGVSHVESGNSRGAGIAQAPGKPTALNRRPEVVISDRI